MSTKNLARTVIEGGRAGRNKRDRKNAASGYRGLEHQRLVHALATANADELAIPGPPGRAAHFRDKLNPARRWLQHQAGRPWDAVRSELFQRFDTRTTPGRHIVFCHMLAWVEDPSPSRFRLERFTVDRHGILRQLDDQRPRTIHHQEPLPYPAPELERWLQGRRVGQRGDALFWFTLTTTDAYRQGRRLNARDATLWRSLPSWFRERHAPSAPPPDPRHRN